MTGLTIGTAGQLLSVTKLPELDLLFDIETFEEKMHNNFYNKYVTIYIYINL